jgi:nitrogen fixation/metabolism regulation signal transduction histidine kinase
VVTTYVTKPLRIVQQQLARISLGKRNEPIEWQSNDEIGGLVSEYNQMLLKLEESAALLAKSEREGAWQEMAKQVAHEIKNPLTPMKLNLQYLQKVVNEGGEDFSGKFKKVSASMIEQIDTLAHIANEFSNFAKMPKVNLEQVNLREVIQSTIELFKSDQAQISFSSEIDFPIVLADKNQCVRVFNNIIKNAVQSIPENRIGKIEINISSQNEMVLVSVKDNGSGISDSMKEKIFVPNFTTKSTGTGLGLAMVKNIITAFGGQIWFESDENEGTTFYLTFQNK